MRNIRCFIDSAAIYEELNFIGENKNIQKYFKYSNGNWSTTFVGFIIKKNQTIVSFPKHYVSSISELNYKDIKLLAKLIKKTVFFPGISKPEDTKENFPLDSYRGICKYYIENGLYFKQKTILKKGYGSNINWIKTINKSSKVINKDNLIIFPFYLEKSSDTYVFLTECMQYVLEDGYNVYGKYFNEGIPYKFESSIKEKISNSLDNVIDKLISVSRNHFKDIEKKLIKNLIDYFKWKVNASNTTLLLTTTFDSYWSLLVHTYINKNFYGLDKNGTFIFKYNCNKHNFSREVSHNIESLKARETSRKFSVRYDHIEVTEDNMYLFDSKYYQEIDGLNYKQFSYDVISRTHYNRVETINNSLILPTDGESYAKVHLDTRDIKGPSSGILIMENYLNVKELISNYLVYD